MYQKIWLTALLTLAVMTGAAFAAIPQVSNVTMGQIAGTRIVRITYDLTQADAIITLAIETNGVALPDSAVVTLIGDVNQEITAGTAGEIIWQAGRDWGENQADNARARITAWSVDNPPQYCAVNVLAGPSAGAGEYPVYYYTSEEGVPDGVTNAVYKTYRILMRRIDPTGGSGFRMGSPPEETGRTTENEAQVDVVLTKPFYMGVYEVTQRQWAQVMDNWPAKFYNEDYRDMRPVDAVSYDDIRGTDEGAKWPGSVDGGDHSVDTTSFLGLLRTRTGLDTFDLPTEAQWEYACRAGTTGALNDGTVNMVGVISDPNLDTLGRYRYNDGYLDNGDTAPKSYCTTENGTAAVGSYLPNAWGLYDMHGNVHEWCLNWFTMPIDAGTDPIGATSGDKRIWRGGRYTNTTPSCRSAYRGSGTPSDANQSGFRLALHLP